MIDRQKPPGCGGGAHQGNIRENSMALGKEKGRVLTHHVKRIETLTSTHRRKDRGENRPYEKREVKCLDPEDQNPDRNRREGRYGGDTIIGIAF